MQAIPIRVRVAALKMPTANPFLITFDEKNGILLFGDID